MKDRVVLFQILLKVAFYLTFSNKLNVKKLKKCLRKTDFLFS